MLKVIILAGGSGTRLWPLSRSYFPKQFIKFDLLGNKSLFQLTFERALKIVDLNDIIIVTNEKQKFLVMGNIEELGYSNYNETNILVEPESKNTFPAIILGMSKVKDSALILSSDHYIPNDFNLRENLNKAEDLSKNSIVIFGITPSNPSVNYGYLKLKDNEVLEFKEKPSENLAREYIANDYLWNSGIFYINKDFLIKELELINLKYKNIFNFNSFSELYSRLPDNSIDFELLEKTKKISGIKLDLDWSDLGSFSSIHLKFKNNLNNNVSFGDIMFKNSLNNLVFENQKNKLVVMENLNDLVVVDTNDVLFISNKNFKTNIKEIIKDLKNKGDERIHFHTLVYRPWGSFTILEDKKNYKVKRLEIHPNKSLSLQSHKFRSEHWVVVQGTAKITLGEKNFNLKTNESVYIPKETKHRLENFGNDNLVVIETQSGTYLGEDDIIRFEDKYGRK